MSLTDAQLDRGGLNLDALDSLMNNGAVPGTVPTPGGRTLHTWAYMETEVTGLLSALGASTVQLDFPNKGAAVAATIPTIMSFIRLAGYGAPGDEGGAIYKKVGSQPSHKGKLQSADGAWWELQGSIVTPQMFGAANDYSATADQAFQDANDYLTAAHSGGMIWVPAGIYMQTGTILLSSNTKIEGVRGASILRAPHGAWTARNVGANSVGCAIGMVGVKHCVVRNISVDHNTTGGGPDVHGIVIDWDFVSAVTTNCVVEGCSVTFFNAKGHYLYWNRNGSNNKFLNNYGNGNVATSNAATAQEGIEVYGGTDVLVQGNTMINIGNNSYYCNPEPSFSGVATEVRYIGNYSKGGQTSFHLLPGSSITNLLVANNIFVGAFANAIEIDCTATLTFNGIAIINNIIDGGVHNLYLDNSGGGVMKDILIAGNLFKNATNTNDGAVFMLNAQDTEFSRNKIFDAAAIGIELVNGTTIKIANNEINGTQKEGILATTNSGTLVKVEILDNDIFGFNTANGGSHGINCSTATDIIIVRNCFNTPHPAVFAITIDSTVSRGIEADNKLIYDPGSQSPVFRNNATNPNKALTTVPGATNATKVVANTLCHNSSDVRLRQTAGTPTTFLINATPGQFTITFPSGGAHGDEIFAYEIR